MPCQKRHQCCHTNGDSPPAEHGKPVVPQIAKQPAHHQNRADEGHDEPNRNIAQRACVALAVAFTAASPTRPSHQWMLPIRVYVLATSALGGLFTGLGFALDNARAALSLGVRSFDASAGGLGGCPYAPGARGNVDTAALVAAVEAEGYTTGVDREAVARAMSSIRQHLRPAAS